ncbi:hypothetical protein GUJ93_ZPchr0001g32328 [Zizania palustris]|uniref:Uncharacterized protein n=1 Tax=Zizania palustris TaxID=103762 RepID=A0A8J5S441_ZIZPA|nr:hypothetical protein GUJ93_ZPchr0001g32328 [Zizania palustris]
MDRVHPSRGEPAVKRDPLPPVGPTSSIEVTCAQKATVHCLLAGTCARRPQGGCYQAIPCPARSAASALPRGESSRVQISMLGACACPAHETSVADPRAASLLSSSSSSLLLSLVNRWGSEF